MDRTADATIAQLVEIKKSNVPQHLQNGAFYHSLSEDTGDEIITVPHNALKSDLVLNCAKDVEHLLTSMRFWGVDGMVAEIVRFVVMQQEHLGNLKSTLEQFEVNFSYLRPLLEWLQQPEGSEVIDCVVQCGDLEMLRCIHEAGISIPESPVYIAVQCGHLPCLMYLLEHGADCNLTLYDAAMRSGHVDCFKCVHTHYFAADPNRRPVNWTAAPIDDTTINCFIFWFHNTPFFAAHAPSLSRAMLYSGVHSISYGHARGLPLTSAHYIRAIELNDFDSFQYLQEIHCPWSLEVAHEAIWRGNLTFLQFALTNGCDWEEEKVCTTAAYYGHVDCLQYAHEQGCPWDSEVCRVAAQNGHVACLVYAHEHGCPWDVMTLVMAVQNDHLTCLQYAHHEGCPWEADILATASKYNNSCGEFVRALLETA